MHCPVITLLPEAGSSAQRSAKWSGLQARMTMSYVWATIGLVLLFVVLAWLTFAVVATTVLAPFVYRVSARDLAQRYAYAATLQSDARGLNSDATFLPHQPYSLSLPETSSAAEDVEVPYTVTVQSKTQRLGFALLITPESSVLASSFPARFPAATPIGVLLPERARVITNALAGRATDGSDGSAVYAAEPVWSRARQPIGAIYIQLPEAHSVMDLLGQQTWRPMTPSLFMIGVLLLVIITPIGGLFGLLTTRGMIQRLRHLATATTQFAAGNYTQRVRLSRWDEIGDLERHFNRMAEHLEESIAEQRKLAEQNARLAERARISRELHDAISQDLFSLRLLASGLKSASSNGADLHPYLETLEQATDGMIRDMRALLLELRPVQLEDVELSQALEALASTYRVRLGIDVRAEVQPVALAEQAQQALFRVAQEALTNAIRHAEASSITLLLHDGPDQIEFVIDDNGKGFEQAEGKVANGLGLGLMHERVQELGGTISIQSRLGAGTRIEIRVPKEGLS